MKNEARQNTATAGLANPFRANSLALNMLEGTIWLIMPTLVRAVQGNAAQDCHKAMN